VLNDILKIFDIGKELGLSKKEIIKLLIFDNSKHAYLWRLLLIIFMLLILIGWYNSMLFLTSRINENVYPSNAAYATIKIKNFKRKIRLIK